MTAGRIDVHAEITHQIIAAIEAGAGDWQMPWHSHGHGLNRPLNIDTAKPYRGVNVISLWAAAQARGFSTGCWGTYRQWQANGCQVRKGEKSSLIIFYKTLAIEEPSDDSNRSDDQPARFVARASRVFNADQVEGYEPAPLPESVDPVEIIERAERFVAATGATIQHGGSSAFYRPSDDLIQMPPHERFLGSETCSATESYYATLLHELTHWTGTPERCERPLARRFGDDAYAMEELVAEMGAAFLCADLGVTLTPRPDHAAYIDGWLRVLKADKKAIFAAASLAAKATDYLASLQQEEAA